MSGNRCFGDLDEGKRILEAPKYFESPVKMTREINNLSLYKFSGAPIYETSTELNIVGLSIFLRTNIAPDSMKHSFGLVQRVGKKTNWLYDLCVYPEHQRSHVDKKKREVFMDHTFIFLMTHLKLTYLTILKIGKDGFQLFAKNINLQIRSSDIMEPLAGSYYYECTSFRYSLECFYPNVF